MPRRSLFALAVVSLAIAVAVVLAVAADRGRPASDAAVAPLDQVYGFDRGGALALQGHETLPAAPGAVVARWHTFRGWNAVLFDGLDLGRSGPLCIGTSILSAAAGQIAYVSNAPTAPGACDAAGAGDVMLAASDRGFRACDGQVGFITLIPAEIIGVRYAWLTVFNSDGTGVGISSRLETGTGPLSELPDSTFGCGRLPAARALPPPTPTARPAALLTPAPASTGSVAAADRRPPRSPTPRGACPRPDVAELQDVTDSAAGPYLLHRPAPGDPGRRTVVFLGGGSGGRTSAQRVWEIVFAGRPQSRGLRVALPYSTDVNFIDEASRTLAIIDEVLACDGGDPAQVHLAGTSNGGLAAFALMAAHAEYFATLLGVPGAFPVQDPATMDPAALRRTLGGRAVFNGVGGRDGAWKPEVIATHNALAAAGIESTYVEFPGEGHVLSATFNPGPLYDFWERH